MANAYNLANIEPLFKKWLSTGKVSFVSRKNYLSDVRHFLGWLSIYFTKYPQDDMYVFNREALIGYLKYLKESAIPEKTVNRRLSTLRKFCAFCFDNGLISENFLSKVVFATDNRNMHDSRHEINSIKHLPLYTSKLVSHLVNRKMDVLTRNLAILLIVTLACGAFFLIFFSKKNVRSTIRVSNNSGRTLTFQGTLSDNLGNPINTKTDVVFRLYDKASGGVPVYTGECIGTDALTPDIHGKFSADIGSDCNMPKIPANVFTDNPTLYLGIAVGSDPEMNPREKIANVGTAATAQTLDGLKLGGQINMIPFIDEYGVLTLAAQSPKIQSTSGTFTISGSTLNLVSDSPNGNINLFPSGGNVFVSGNLSVGSSTPGNFKLQVAGNMGPEIGYVYNLGSPLRQWANVYGEKFYQNNYEVCDTSGNCGGTNIWDTYGRNTYVNSGVTNVGIGSTNPLHKLSVEGNIAGKALVGLWEKGDQDILVASRSATFPTTVFRLTNNGNIKTPDGSRWMPLSNGTGALNIANASDTTLVRFDTNNMRVGIGTSPPEGTLQVNGANAGKALVIFDETGDQNILVASASGSTKFILDRSGNLALGKGSVGSGKQIDTSSGAYLSSSGVWTDASSREWKENFTGLDYTDILNKVKKLPITSWNYKSDSDQIKHLGPLAEDFFDAFGLGNDKQHIASLDTAGVALAAVKGLSSELDQRLKDLDSKIKASSGLNDNLYKDALNDNIPSVQYIYSGLIPSSNVDNDAIDRFFKNDVVNAVFTSLESVGESVVHNLVIAKTVTTDTLFALNSHIDNIVSRNIIVREKLSSPIVETTDFYASGKAKVAKLETNQINVNSDNLTIDINSQDSNNNSDKATNGTNRGKLAEVIIKGLEGKTVASINERGDATFSGTLEAANIQTGNINTTQLNAETATIEGSLIADTIRAKNIDELASKVDSSGQALNSQENAIHDLDSMVNQVQKQLGELKSLPYTPDNYQQLLNDILNSLGNIVGNSKLTASDVSNKDSSLENLNVLGSTNTYKANISDSLLVGNVYIRDNTIQSLGWDLNISSLSEVRFFDGIVSLHKDGSIISQGEIIAQGGLRANSLSPIGPAEDINIKLNGTAKQSKLTITDAANKEVGSIDSQGDASFNSLSLNNYKPAGISSVITASANYAANGVYVPALETDNYTAGEAIIPPQNYQIIVYNQHVSDKSLIYLTSTNTDTSVHLSIIEKNTCSTELPSCRPYFKVGADKPLPTPITFNWLLVN